MDRLTKFRRYIHSNPDLSGKEGPTAERILSAVKDFPPGRIIQKVGGEGLMLVYEGKEPGPNIMFRCELDALPIQEKNNIPHVSGRKGVAHLCGHDGHMTILLGLAQKLYNNKKRKGKTILLFQPEEETGQGAEKVVNDPQFNNQAPDYAFAIHNLPGFPLHSVILSPEGFASASQGMVIRLHGKTSHAGEPDKGINPSMAVSEIIRELQTMSMQGQLFKDFVLITIIHVLVGEIAFGTSPGEAVVRATLRSYRDDDMRMLTSRAEQFVEQIAKQYNLQFDISYTEVFPATKNHPRMVKIVEQSAEKLDLEILELTEPMRWSEDFGHFTNLLPGALIGLGSGNDQPDLHNPDFDFPDELIGTGADLFYEIYLNIIDQHK